MSDKKPLSTASRANTFFGVDLVAANLSKGEIRCLDYGLLYYRCSWQAFRDARERGDFGAMLTAECQAVETADTTRNRMINEMGMNAEAVERYLVEEKRFILDRTEQCERCTFLWKDFQKSRRDWERHFPLNFTSNIIVVKIS